MGGLGAVLLLGLGTSKKGGPSFFGESARDAKAKAAPVPYPRGVTQEKHLAYFDNLVGQKASFFSPYPVRYDFNAGEKTASILKNRHELAPKDSDYLMSVWKVQAAEFVRRRFGVDPHTVAGGTTYPVLVPKISNGKPVAWELQTLTWYGATPEGVGGIDALGLIGNVGNMVLPYIPGYGTAANAALQAAVALGKGKSLKEAGLAAARGALPPWGQVAFDMGVGIASGQSVDEAAQGAALDYLETKYPGAKDAYWKAREMVK